MSTPTTPAGKALHDACRRPSTAPTRPEVQYAITAIEAEGAATERARIAGLVRAMPSQAMDTLVPNTGPDVVDRAAVLAAIEGESK